MFHIIFPHYPCVKPIVGRFQSIYQKDFPSIRNWDALGKLVLVDLIQENPEYLFDLTTLQLTFRISFAKALSLLTDDQLGRSTTMTNDA